MQRVEAQTPLEHSLSRNGLYYSQSPSSFLCFSPEICFASVKACNPNLYAFDIIDWVGCVYAYQEEEMDRHYV